jgi:hypothetical protein
LERNEWVAAYFTNIITLGYLEGLMKSEKSLRPLRQIFGGGVSRIKSVY